VNNNSSNSSSNNNNVSSPVYRYDWENSTCRNALWKELTSVNNNGTIRNKVYLETGTRLDVFQVVGTCSHFRVQTIRILMKIADAISGYAYEEYLNISLNNSN